MSEMRTDNLIFLHCIIIIDVGYHSDCYRCRLVYQTKACKKEDILSKWKMAKRVSCLVIIISSL